MNDVHFSSKSNEWETPIEFFNKLNEEFHFTLDVAATPENAKCSRYFTVTEDGLTQDWSKDICWMNPPYGYSVGKWIKKAMRSADHGATVVALIPAKTETRWWAEFWDYEKHRPIDGVEVRFVFGRIQFGNSGINAPFPNAVVIFRQEKRGC